VSKQLTKEANLINADAKDGGKMKKSTQLTVDELLAEV
jgi:hypothetical protein